MTRCYPYHSCARCGRDLAASPGAPTRTVSVAAYDGGYFLGLQCDCDCGYNPVARPHTPDCAERRCHAIERMRCEYVSSDDCSMIPRVDRDAEACCAIVGQIGHLCQLGRVPSVCRRA